MTIIHTLCVCVCVCVCVYVFTLVISYSSSLFHSSSLSFHHPPTSLLILHPSIERSDLLSLLEKKSVVTDIASLSRRRRGDGLIQKPARETEMDLFKNQQERRWTYSKTSKRDRDGLIQNPARDRVGLIQKPARDRDGLIQKPARERGLIQKPASHSFRAFGRSSDVGECSAETRRPCRDGQRRTNDQRSDQKDATEAGRETHATT